jgi:hypothetical protein
LSQRSSPKVPRIGGVGAEALNTEAKKLHRIDIGLMRSKIILLEIAIISFKKLITQANDSTTISRTSLK